MARRRCLFGTKLYGIFSGVTYDGGLALPSYGYASGESHTVTIVSNRQWTIDQTGLPNWVSLSTTAGTKGKTNLVVTTVSANTTSDDRSGSFTVRTKNNTKTLVVTFTQTCHNVSLYLYSIHGSNLVPPRIDVDYDTVATTGHVFFNSWNYPGEYIGTYPEGTLFSFTASTVGYYDTIRSFQISDLGGGEEHIDISFSADTQKDSFEITNVFYSGETMYSACVVEDRWMPEETFFTSAGTPLRPGLIQVWKKYEHTLVDDEWYTRDIKVEFLTSIPLSDIFADAEYISGGTEWLENPNSSRYSIENESTYLGGSDGLSACTMNVRTNVYTAREKVSGETVHVANLRFYNHRLNDELLAILPVVTETRQDDVMRIYPHNNPTSGKDGELYVNVLASSGFTEFDVLTSRITNLFPIDQGVEYNFSALTMYDSTRTNVIKRMYPTVISGSNGTITFANNGKFLLEIKNPSNPSYSETKKYGTTLQMEDFNRQFHDGIRGYIYITQGKNQDHYTDFEISAFTLSYTGNGSSVMSDTGITIPSSSITYNRPDQYGIQSQVIIGCRYYSEDGSFNHTGHVYNNYIIPDGGGSTPDASKLTVEYPQWLYLANGTGGTTSEHSASQYAPYAFNAYANQTTASTGSDRTGDVTITWHQGPIREGGASAKTVTVTQPWGRLPQTYAAYLAYLNNNPLGNNVLSTSTTITAGGQVTLDLSAVSGSKIIFSNYMGDITVQNNLGITIGGETVPTSSYEYTVGKTGLVRVIITDKRYASTYNLTLQIDNSSAPSGYALANLRLQIRK